MSNNNSNNKPASPWASVPVNISSGNFMMPFFPGFNYNPNGNPVPEEPKDDRDGCVCKTCKDFYAFAEPNQEDKKTFICYSCRHGY